jgi:hypothetical protein
MPIFRHPATWFVLGAASVLAYHKYVKPVPTNKTA